MNGVNVHGGGSFRSSNPNELRNSSILEQPLATWAMDPETQEGLDGSGFPPGGAKHKNLLCLPVSWGWNAYRQGICTEILCNIKDVSW